MSNLQGWYFFITVIAGLGLAHTSPRKDDPWLWVICTAYGIFWPITLPCTLVIFIAKRKGDDSIEF